MPLTEEIHSAGVADKIAVHESAAHDKRNWVRLTFDCNNRCIFCLDSDTHDGEMRDRGEVKKQILDGRAQGATRLILSGGEPTMHPNYIDFIQLGRMAGYPKIQTVTNGRMFQYQDFMDKCLDAGLSEITFSLHGPNARIHDALVGVKGAFEQESAGLRRAIADGRPIVNVDIVINRANVRHLKEMLDLYISWGVREFDLLQVVPFGRAYTEGKDTLFYDLEEMRPYLLAAFEYCNRDDLHIWLNRFPPQHLEGFEHLIQDPYKLNDEVRGRKEEFARLLDEGIDLDCREPEGRCKYCYLEKLCGTLDGVRRQDAAGRFDVVRVDSAWEAAQGPVFGGDPASARRAKAEAAALRPDGKLGLPLLGVGALALRDPVPLPERARQVGATTLQIVAADLAGARAELAKFPSIERVELELADYTGLDGGMLDGKPIVSAYVHSADAAQALLALGASFEVVVALSKATAPWLLSLTAAPTRLALRQPRHERLTESADEDVALREFFAAFKLELPLEGVPTCISGRTPRARPATLDGSMTTPDGRLEIFRYTKRYIVEHYMTKSLRCKTCIHDKSCEGVHVNHVRAHGYQVLQPVTA